MYYPNVLVVSNNSFSKTGSNGRTLANFFLGWPKEHLAQFCISTDAPDYDVCNNYYLVTDKSALNGFVHFKKAGRSDIKTNLNTKGNSKVSNRTIQKSPITSMIRNLVWLPKRWKSEAFSNWVDGFNPEIVLLMNSDAIFMLKVATDLSRERHIPLVMYNTEGYYFFKKPYVQSNQLGNLFFKVYQFYYKKQFAKTMQNVAFTIYSNTKLQNDYANEFSGKNNVIYLGSSIKPFEGDAFNTERPIFSYIGNLAYSRIDALIEVAEVLQSINQTYVLNVYGNYNATIADKVKNCKGIRLMGFITYDQVLDTIKHSDILFHAETQDKKWEEALKYGFSTKIADSISSGKCFVMYSSPNIAGADYIVKTGAGWFASNKEELKYSINTIIGDEKERKRVLSQARLVAETYHQVQYNCDMFRQVLDDIITKG